MTEPTNKKNARNAEILKLIENGMTYLEIAAVLGISVCMIVKRELGKELSPSEAKAFLVNIKQSDNLDLEIPPKKLLDAIGIGGMVANSINDYFRNKGYTSITLRQLMDLLIPNTALTKNTIPALKLNRVGLKTYIALLMRFSSADFGDAFKTEWSKRKKRLADADWIMPHIKGQWWFF